MTGNEAVANKKLRSGNLVILCIMSFLVVIILTSTIMFSHVYLAILGIGLTMALFASLCTYLTIKSYTENNLSIEREEMLSSQAALLQLAHDAIFVRNGKNEIIFWNKGAEATYGWTEEEAVGRITHDLLHTVFPEELSAIEAELYANQQWNGELVHTCKDGKKIVVASRWAIQRDKFGKITGYMEINRNISNRKKIEQERQELIQKLLDSNTELERFAYVASHDLQEPIRMVTNFSKLVLHDYGKNMDDDGLEYLNIIADAGVRMQETINDLLQYSRIDNETAHMTDFDGEVLLDNTLVNLDVLITEGKAKITHDALPMLYGNPIQFGRVLQNLIANAIKYKSPNLTPHIHISVKEEEAAWCIGIKDNGMGIAEEFLQEIFQPFRRLHNWDTIRGTGLGLSICKRIIENHGGKLWVVSIPAEGSTFYFTLPKSITKGP